MKSLGILEAIAALSIGTISYHYGSEAYKYFSEGNLAVGTFCTLMGLGCLAAGIYVGKESVNELRTCI